MKILVSAGGTRESIDTVRSITNHSTGRLGSVIADTFAKNGASVTYLCAENAILPKSANIEIIRISDVESLQWAMERLFDAHKFDAVIHSMAVSDFTPFGTLALNDIVENVVSVVKEVHLLEQDELRDRVKAVILSACSLSAESKISSKDANLMIMLKKTPKVIELIRKMQPGTVLVGFKLLSNVAEAELLQVAKDLMVKNDCDFVLANDLKNINGDKHEAILIDKNGKQYRAENKQGIADTIYKAVTEAYGTTMC